MKLDDRTKKSFIYRDKIPEFKIRNYVHFDHPSTSQEQEKVDQLFEKINNPAYIKSHAFYPLIASNSKERRRSKLEQFLYYENMLKTTTDPEIIKVCEQYVEKFKKTGLVKEREIRIAAHSDALIYSHYARILDELYNKKVSELGFSDEIVANRLLWKPEAAIKEHINLNTVASYDAVKFILDLHCNCYALAFDLSSFYDTIDHKKMKEEWKKLLNVDELPPDHYAVYKAITKSCYVDRTEIDEYLTHLRKKAEAELWKKKKESGSKDKKLSDEEKEQLDKEFKFGNVFNHPSDFRRFRNWYFNNPKYKNFKNFHKPEGAGKYGIPQGINISSVLSNIYMIPFDEVMHKFASEHKGFYRRYCDDILLVIPHDEKLKDEAIDLLKKTIADRGSEIKLHNISPWDKYSKSQCYDFTDRETIKKHPMQYLGYYFDGDQVRIRESSITNYRRKMSKHVWYMYEAKIRRLVRLFNEDIKLLINASKDELVDLSKIHKHKLYQLYTFRGTKNFISYANSSANKFKDVLASNAGIPESEFVTSIERQLRNHCMVLKKTISTAENVILDYLTSLQGKPKDNKK